MQLWMFTSKSFEQTQKKHELSCLIIIFALQLFETALTSVMFSISSSSAARDGGQNVRFTFYLFLSIYFSFLCCRWTLHTSNIYYLATCLPSEDWNQFQVWGEDWTRQSRTQQRTHYAGNLRAKLRSWRGEERRLGWTVLFISFDVPLPGAGWMWLVVCGLSEFFWLQNEINLMRYDILVISNSPGIKLEIYIKNITRIFQTLCNYGNLSLNITMTFDKTHKEVNLVSCKIN